MENLSMKELRRPVERQRLGKKVQCGTMRRWQVRGEDY
jgi:hypothetical protein